MRTTPPHRFIRYRLLLMAIALSSLAIGAAILATWKYHPPMPLAAKAVFAVAVVMFVWLNGASWWIEVCYPHQEISAGKYASRVEQSSRLMQIYQRLFFFVYAICATFATIAIVRVVSGG